MRTCRFICMSMCMYCCDQPGGSSLCICLRLPNNYMYKYISVAAYGTYLAKHVVVHVNANLVEPAYRLEDPNLSIRGARRVKRGARCWA